MADWELDSPETDESSRSRASAPGPPGGAPSTAQAPPAAPLTPSSPSPAATEPAPPPRRRSRFSYAWLGALAVALLAGLIGGFFIARAQTSGSEAEVAKANARVGELQGALSRSEERNWSYYRETEGLKEQLRSVTSSTSTTTPSPGAKRTYGPGVYLVGEDIPPGTYDGTVSGSIGYWARLQATDGQIASIIENGIVQGPFVLTIETREKAVELRGVTLTPR